MHTLLYIVTAWLAADLVTGAVHWWEDRYGNPDWPVIGKLVVQPNIKHHSEPRAFLEGNYWDRNWTTIAPAAVVSGLFLVFGQHWLALVAAFSTQANEIHGWAHQKCSRGIRGLQLLGVITSQEGHAQHHQSPFSTNFCVMTDWTNPVLSSIYFWRALEWLVGLTGIHPRVERELA
jgi:hypothetical protein